MIWYKREIDMKSWKTRGGHLSWSLSQTRQGYSTKLFFDIDYPNCNSSIFLCKWSDLQVFAAEILADGANFYAQSNTASNICLRPKAVNPKVASRWCACLMRSPGKHKTVGENITAVTGAAVLSEGVSNGHIQSSYLYGQTHVGALKSQTELLVTF